MFAQLVKRNTLIYLREKGSVFFSLLSALIVIMLMVFFLGDMSVDAISEVLAAFPGRDSAADIENAGNFVLLWTLAGILSINAVTVTMAVYSTMITDRANGRLNSIYTAPVSRMTITAAYICAAWLCSVMICLATLAAAQVVCLCSGLGMFGAGTWLKLIGLVALNSFVFAAIMYCLAAVIRSPGAWSGIGTVVGTLVGFLGGIYLPIGNLSDGVAAVLKCTPVIYIAQLFRAVMTEDICSVIFEGAPEAVEAEIRKFFGIDLSVFGHEVTPALSIAALAACGVVFLLLGTLLTKYARRDKR